MANVFIVLGPTGSGKSTSTQNLDPKKTFMINVLGKPLPFKGSRKNYNAENKNHFVSTNHDTINKVLKSIPEKMKHIENIIIDDMRYVMVEEFFKRASETGYGKFASIAQHFQSVIETAKNLPDNINVVFMLHDDDKTSDNFIVEKKPKLVGKMVEDQYNPLEVVTCTLYAEVEFNEKDEPEYGFLTQRCKRNNVTIPSKSPQGMFPELKIPNDLALVFKKAKEYYEG